MQTNPDPTRPRYHFCAPTGWMNDPNGAIFHQGWYHVFYQWNPNGDQWGDIHWGHARSRDLVAWEHLPVALEPDAASGEEHCFSGCLALRAAQPPIILYTAIGPQMTSGESAQQLAALGDDDLISWQKHPRNPILTAQIHGELDVLEWRDPFIFTDSGRTFLLLGGKLTPKDGGDPVILLYEAQDPTLEQWTYRRVFFRHPDKTRASAECPNFFKSGPKWVLLLSADKQVEYYVGDFDADAGSFTPHTSGLLNGSEHFYATNLLLDDQQRCICFGWVRGFAPGRGWSGCHALPRVLWLDEQGRLHQTPAPELNLLHGPGFHTCDVPLGGYPVPGFESDTFEVRAVIAGQAPASFGIRLIPTNKQAQTITLTCAPDETRLQDMVILYRRDGEAAVDIRLFLDCSVVEVFIDDCASLTLTLPPIASSYRIELFSEGAASLRRLDVWRMDNVR